MKMGQTVTFLGGIAAMLFGLLMAVGSALNMSGYDEEHTLSWHTTVALLLGLLPLGIGFALCRRAWARRRTRALGSTPAGAAEATPAAPEVRLGSRKSEYDAGTRKGAYERRADKGPS